MHGTCLSAVPLLFFPHRHDDVTPSRFRALESYVLRVLDGNEIKLWSSPSLSVFTVFVDLFFIHTISVGLISGCSIEQYFCFIFIVQRQKEDYYKMTQDGPEAQTWTDFEEDCDAVNQARASNINDSGYSAYQRVFGKNPPQMEDAVLECGGADLSVVSRQQTGELAQERSMTMRRIALQASLVLKSQASMETSLAPRSETLQGRTARWTTPLVSETWSERSIKTNQRFLAPGCSNQDTLAKVWIA